VISGDEPALGVGGGIWSLHPSFDPWPNIDALVPALQPPASRRCAEKTLVPQQNKDGRSAVAES
jgi:hypothetical protein